MVIEYLTCNLLETEGQIKVSEIRRLEYVEREGIFYCFINPY